MKNINYFVQFLLIIPYSVFCDHDTLVDVGSNSYSRPLTESMSKVSLIPNDKNVMTSSGKVMSFTYNSVISGQELKFQIWRSASSSSKFTLIHQTATVITPGTGTFTYRCTEEENFFVVAGDTIGVAIFDTNPFSYSTVNCSTSIDKPLTNSETSLGEGDSVDFSQTGSECKEYSVNANVLYDTAEVASLACTSLTADDGFREVTSPDYDGTAFYPISTHSCWKISLASNYTDDEGRWGIQVQILAFSFEQPLISGTCGADYVEFKNGETVFGYLLQELCGTTYPEFVNSTAGSMYMRMYTDNNVLTVSTGFKLQYRVYEIEKPTTPNWVLALGVLGCLLLIVPVVIVVILWCRLKRKRDREDQEKLKDGEMGFGDDKSEDDFESVQRKRNRVRSAKISPQMVRREKSLYNDPKGKEVRVDAHRDINLRDHIPKDERIPDASNYRAPRKSGKMKHWSQLSTGVTG